MVTEPSLLSEVLASPGSTNVCLHARCTHSTQFPNTVDESIVVVGDLLSYL